jgi:hypothetical protein
MAEKVTLNEWLSHYKRDWKSLVAFGSFVAGVNWFLRTPPGVGNGSTEIRAIGILVVTLTIPVHIGIAYRFNKKRHLTAWLIMLLLLLFLSIFSVVTYERAFPRYTCEYRGHLLVIGDVLTKRADTIGKTLEKSECDDLLYEFAGKVSDVWTPASINHCRTVLVVEYLVAHILFAASVLTATQLVRLIFDSGSPIADARVTSRSAPES